MYIIRYTEIQNNILLSAKKFKVKRVIFLGSSCIYPKHSKIPIKEDYIMTGKLEKTNEAYAMSKLYGIKLSSILHEEFNQDIICLMPTNLYGIKDNFDIANIHHISTPDGKCDKEFWVDEFASLLKTTNINKPIWVTEAMTCGPPVKAYINAFLNGAEIIVDVGINAPGMKMSKKGRKNLNEFISNYDGFSSLKRVSKTEVEFQYKDGSTKAFKLN